MISLVILFICCFILFVLSMKLFHRDFFAPSVLLNAEFMISILMLMPKTKEWRVAISAETITIIVSVLILSVVVEYFCSRSTFKQKSILIENQGRQNTEISAPVRSKEIQRLIFWPALLFSTLVVALYFKEVVRVASYGSHYGGSMLANYRAITSFDDALSAENMINPLLVQGSKLLFLLTYASLYVFIYNMTVCRQKFFGNAKYLLPTILNLFFGYINSYRQHIFIMLFFSLIVAYTLDAQKRGWRKRKNRKYAKVAIVALLIVFVVFSNTALLVGRSVQFDVIETLARYGGAPIYSLDDYVKNPNPLYSQWGSEVFVGIYRSLYKLGLVSQQMIVQLEFTYVNGRMIGNNYTDIRRPLNDFGYIGMMLFYFLLFSLYYSVYHKKIVGRAYTKRFENTLFMYAYYAYPFGFFSTSGQFYSLLSIGNVITFALLYFGVKLIVRDARRKGRGQTSYCFLNCAAGRNSTV